MKYFFDTNIILILFQGRNSEIKDQARSLLSCEQNSFYTSSISLLEILQLYRKKKIDGIDYNSIDSGEKLIKLILKTIDMVEVLPFNYEHTLVAGRLTFVPKHNDPNDLAIIAHAIAEKMPIITCDDKFPEYKSQGVVVIHNPR